MSAGRLVVSQHRSKTECSGPAGEWTRKPAGRFEIERNSITVRTGVYRIRNTINGRLYVGSSTTAIAYRFAKHKLLLRQGRHHSVTLQRAWNKYGESAFAFEIVENFEARFCVAQEQVFIDWWKSANPRFGYNICPTAGSQRGIKRTPEQIEKTASKTRGISRDSTLSIEARARLSSMFSGRKLSDEIRAKMSRSHTGVPLGLSTREKMSDTKRRAFRKPLLGAMELPFQSELKE